MTHPSKRTCDICRDVVAIKRGLFYHTEKSYVTLRGDDPSFMEDINTKKDKIHICDKCMSLLKSAIIKEIKG